MQQFFKIGLLSQLIYISSSSALNPQQGFYAGLLGSISHGPSKDDVYFREDDQLFHGIVGYSNISGGGGLMAGYRFNQIRGELELFANRISTGPVTVGTCVIQNINVVTPTGACPAGIYDSFQEKALGYSGNSTAIYGFFNGIWDFMPYESSKVVAPYIGIGAGMASIKNGSSFVNTRTLFSTGASRSGNGIAYQGILGVSYFMDDFTWCSIDFRYLDARPKLNTKTNLGINIANENYALSTINFTVNGTFG